MSKLDIIDLEFNRLMKEMEDRINQPCVSEDFERQQHQTINCKHGIPRQQCANCKVTPKPYWPPDGKHS